MKQAHVITQFVIENYPGYLQFMAAHSPVKLDSDDARAEFLVTVIPELKNRYDAAYYAAVLKKHLPEKIEPARLETFAKQFFDFHFQRTRDRGNERLVILYKAAAYLLIVQMVIFSAISGILMFVFFQLIAFLIFFIPVFTIILALRKSKYEPLRIVDHIVFAANLLFNIIMICWMFDFVF